MHHAPAEASLKFRIAFFKNPHHHRIGARISAAPKSRVPYLSRRKQAASVKRTADSPLQIRAEAQANRRKDVALHGRQGGLSSLRRAKPGQILISPHVLMAVGDAITVEPAGKVTLNVTLPARWISGGSPSVASAPLPLRRLTRRRTAIRLTPGHFARMQSLGRPSAG